MISPLYLLFCNCFHISLTMNYKTHLLKKLKRYFAELRGQWSLRRQALGDIDARNSQPNPFSVSFSSVCPNICPRWESLLTELEATRLCRTASCCLSLLRILALRSLNCSCFRIHLCVRTYSLRTYPKFLLLLLVVCFVSSHIKPNVHGHNDVTAH
jgi:hypothetical protein